MRSGFVAVVAAVLLPFASAAPTITDAPGYYPAYPATTHTVKVGGLDGTTPILKYNPEYVADVKVGDVVLFDILANNHTVTESTFDAPCVPKAGGIDSGFRPNMQNIPGKMTFPVTVTDDKPRWFYCAQPGNGKPHCQAGMVFAINAPKTGDKTLEAFKKLAAAAVPVPSAPSLTTRGTPSPTGGTAATYTVKVGGLDGTTPILKYNPEYVADVKVGDVVLFDILANNHTVTESTFDAPCVPKAGGIDSGFRPNMQNIPGKMTFPVTVTDDKPRWFYCAQPGNGKPHCQAGMVFAINAPKTGDKTLEAFKKLAAAVPVGGAPSPTTGATGPAVTHYVKVGGLVNNVPVLKYNPEFVKANVGDVIRFDFLAANHTLTESSFHYPCVPNGGIDSGFRPNMQNVPGAQLFTVNVYDDKPKWFYCAQPGNGKPHCQAGMVFAINPPASGDNTLEAFKAKAAKVPVK